MTSVPRRHRLRGSKSIRVVLGEGRRARIGPVQAAARPTGIERSDDGRFWPTFRVAVITTRGFANSVTRNRARRRVEGAVWKRRRVLREGYDYVVIARPGVERLPSKELENRVVQALTRAVAGRDGSDSKTNANFGADAPEPVWVRPTEQDRAERPRLSKPTNLSVTTVRLYQRIISPMLGPRCRYYPSCSQYAIDSLRAYGFWKGWLFAARRVLRCHPWAPGGYDPVAVSKDK